MNNIRLLPVVIAAIAALLVLKTVGLVTHGGYVLSGVTVAEAASGGGGGKSAEAKPGETITLPSEPTIADTSPTLADPAPTLGQADAGAAGGGHGAPAASGEAAPAAAEASAAGHGATAPATTDAAAATGETPPAADATNVIAAENECDPKPVLAEGEKPTADGQLMVVPGNCPPLTDAVPQMVTQDGLVPLSGDGTALTDQTLLERLGERRTELDNYAKELEMRASLVDAAEKRIEERQQTLKAIEDQIAAKVDERKKMEEGQFAGIVSLYETMKPKDAAAIFDNLDLDVLVKVAKMMNPRKLAPILAAMNTSRAQEVTVRLASADADPIESMTPDAMAALPQIVGQ